MHACLEEIGLEIMCVYTATEAKQGEKPKKTKENNATHISQH